MLVLKVNTYIAYLSERSSAIAYEIVPCQHVKIRHNTDVTLVPVQAVALRYEANEQGIYPGEADINKFVFM